MSLQYLFTMPLSEITTYILRTRHLPPSKKKNLTCTGLRGMRGDEFFLQRAHRNGQAGWH